VSGPEKKGEQTRSKKASTGSFWGHKGNERRGQGGEPGQTGETWLVELLDTRKGGGGGSKDGRERFGTTPGCKREAKRGTKEDNEAGDTNKGGGRNKKQYWRRGKARKGE